ncbi:WbqC family protein [Chryseobacterium indologenes]|uniref:WbqC family protein n=1 Tax=Chryseobacterium TaxID=59732 RepID=UPI001628432E|nr:MULTISPECIES: WbqC family protein [Chryseobacterium]MDM1553647.1 WbqC family protein [Chryseobacterium indologenes]WET48383.1 WbqC family protein [Chryseobacterium indologenes]
MKTAIMQPYFMPYIGYLSLIKHSDLFILFDPVQFIRHGWIERNRVLKQNEGWLYINVPLLKSGRDTLIKDCLIDNSKDWKGKILSQLQIYKKQAPYYYKTVQLLKEIFEGEYDTITALNKASLEKICNYLGFPKELPVFSEMNMEIEEPNSPDEWALNICKKLGGNIHYINPIGGLEFFDTKKYTHQNIDISFQKMIPVHYDQKRTPFEYGLSIIDVMMFNSPEEINAMLDQFELVNE